MTLADVADSRRLFIERQHTVTRSLLKQFAEPDKRNGTLKVGSFDLQSGRLRRPLPPKSLGHSKHFQIWDAPTSERLWGAIEEKMTPDLFVRAHSSSLTDEDSSFIRSFIGLHLYRSLHFQNQLEPAIASTKAAAAKRATLREFATLFNSGVLIADSMRRAVDRASHVFQLGALEIARSAGEAELLISDDPVSVQDPSGRWAQETPMLDLLVAAMPLGPRTLALINRDGTGTGVRYVELTPERADSYNRLQLEQAKRLVMFRPSSRLADVVATWCRGAGTGVPTDRV